jgi:hypothetical protein
LLGVSAISILIGLPFEAWIALGFKMITTFYARALLYGSLGVLMILKLLKITSVSEKTVSKNLRQIFMSVYIFILIWQGINFMKSAISIYSYPDVADCELIDWPVKDTWFVGHGGGTEHLNYHFVADQQRYAIDILKIGEKGILFRFKIAELNRWGDFERKSDFYPLRNDLIKPLR